MQTHIIYITIQQLTTVLENVHKKHATAMTKLRINTYCKLLMNTIEELGAIT